MSIISVTGSTYKDSSGAVYYRYNSSPAPNGNYASGSFMISTRKGVVRFTPEQAYEEALRKSYAYLGISPENETESYNQLVSKEIETQKVKNALHEKREALRQGFAGTFSDTAIQDVTTDPGNYLPSYIQNLPQNKAETMIKEGKIGGWQVGDRYFRTEIEANNYVKNNQQQTQAPLSSPPPPPNWLPDLSGQPKLQVYKYLQNQFNEKYEPAVTIEGTTIYKAKQKAKTIEPVFGIFYPDKFTSAVENRLIQIQDDLHYADMEVASKLNLGRVINPVIKKLESIDYSKHRGGVELGRKLKAQDEFIIGALSGIRDKPLTIAGNTAFAILVTKGVGGLVAKVPALNTGIGAGKIASKINAVNILGAGLAGMYAGDVIIRYSQAPNKARFAGELAATELVPFALGGRIATRIKTPPISEIYSQTSRGAAIAKINIELALRRQYKQQSISLEDFLRNEDAQVTLKKKRRSELIQILKPKESEIVKEVEVIRADIALAEQLKAEQLRYSVSKRQYNQQQKLEVASKRTQRVAEIQKSKMQLIPISSMVSELMPVQAQNNISLAIQLLNPKAIQQPISIQRPIVTQRTISIQQPIPIQQPVSIQSSVAIQKALAIQQALTVQKMKQIEQKITKSKSKQTIKPIIKKPKLLSPKAFEDLIKTYAKDKRRSKYVWDITNPVPTLKDIIGK